jgi:hypothetical protein
MIPLFTNFRHFLTFDLLILVSLGIKFPDEIKTTTLSIYWNNLYRRLQQR